MAERPLLILPAPDVVDPARARPGGGSSIRFPSRSDQVARLRATFARLQELAEQSGDLSQLAEDPGSLAPERVVVFEVAGSVDDFARAVGAVPGFEFVGEYDEDFPPDDQFSILDSRKGHEGEDRQDKPVGGRVYMALPNLSALEELIRLWGKWERGERLPRGFAPFAAVFKQVLTIRPWGPEDRVPPETIAYWQELQDENPTRPIRTEVELWFHTDGARRRRASESLRRHVEELGGSVVHESIIPEIAYHGALIDIPANEVAVLLERRAVRLALADEVMFLRPQSLLLGPADIDDHETEFSDISFSDAPLDSQEPIAALLDGVPVGNHVRLVNRVVIDDPDELEDRSTVSRRFHGTSMASLIIHGDLLDNDVPINRPLYIHPVMYSPPSGTETTDEDRLLIDTIYRAITRMKGSPSAPGASPSVFLVNVSLGDLRRPFAQLMSPLARLLDYLSVRYGILFLVSAGNVTANLDIPAFSDWSSFTGSTPEEQTRAVVRALNQVKRERSILAPAESINSLTIGGLHADLVAPQTTPQHLHFPFADSSLPNISSALGLGHHRSVKPDLYLPAGRELIMQKSTTEGLRVAISTASSLFGLKAAAPDKTGLGRLDAEILQNGTSAATAMATHAAHRIFDTLFGSSENLLSVEMEPRFLPVVIKSLLVHSARWSTTASMLKEVCGPDDGRRFVERSENASRFLGFGSIDVTRVFECTRNRATLVGFGDVAPGSALSFRIPLPECLEGVTDPRSVTLTLAWLSPVNPKHRAYRRAALEIGPTRDLGEVLGVSRDTGFQPAKIATRRGTVIHERFQGQNAVPFIDNGYLAVRVTCRAGAGVLESSVPFGLSVTIEAETDIPVYDQIRARLRVQPLP